MRKQINNAAEENPVDPQLKRKMEEKARKEKNKLWLRELVRIYCWGFFIITLMIIPILIANLLIANIDRIWQILIAEVVGGVSAFLIHVLIWNPSYSGAWQFIVSFIIVPPWGGAVLGFAFEGMEGAYKGFVLGISLIFLGVALSFSGSSTDRSWSYEHFRCSSFRDE